MGAGNGISSAVVSRLRQVRGPPCLTLAILPRPLIDKRKMKCGDSHELHATGGSDKTGRARTRQWLLPELRRTDRKGGQAFPRRASARPTAARSPPENRTGGRSGGECPVDRRK